MFTEAKFRSLSAPHRAKKIAELLRSLIANEREDWKRALVEYRDLCRWAGDESHPLDPQTLQLRPTADAYLFWRGQAGLGPERDLISSLNSGDRGERAAEPLPWIVWMHNLRSGHNVGSAIRTADCMGLGGVWLSGYTAPPANAREPLIVLTTGLVHRTLPVALSRAQTAPVPAPSSSATAQ